jgi:alanine racemase
MGDVHMNQLSYRDTWAEISLNHIKENYHQFRQFISPNVKIMAVVKADGYGHGATEIAKSTIEAGVDYLAVAILDEAIALRVSGITQPILVLGYTPKRSVKAAILENITLTVFDHEVLDEVIIQSNILNKMASIHLKIDTGMSRIGVSSHEDARIIAQKATNSLHVDLEGIFTHFANADNENTHLTYSQYNQFQSIVEYLEDHGIYIPIKHCCNSAAAMKFPDMHLDMVRIGVALYGLYPDSSLKKHMIQLKQAMTFKTKIAAIKKVAANQAISYGWTWKPERESMIATLPLGYADGLSRLLSNQGKVLVHGNLSNITGRVCMDQTMIDVTDISNCSVGDEVTIFGHSNSSFQSVDQIAEIMGTINYEVVCLIGKRVPRMFVTNENRIEPAEYININ